MAPSITSYSIIMESRDHTQMLPIDVWRECLDLLAMEEYLSLYQTSWFFNGIATPLVYRRIKYAYEVEMLSHHMAQQHLKGVKRQIRHFVNLAEDASRSAWVRECRLIYSLKIPTKSSDDYRVNAEKAYATYVEAFITHIKKFTNLRRVYFDFNRNMDKKIMAALSSLPHLEEVGLRAVKFGAHQLQPRLNIRKLCITNGRTDRNPNPTAKTLDILANDCLEEMDLDSKVYTPKIFASLTAHGSSQCLRDLRFSMDPEDVDLLYRFLETCPNLESICWTSYKRDYWCTEDFPSTLERLPASSMPRLKSYSGPNVAAKAFIPGRPVEKVTLNNDRSHNQEWTQTLRAVSLSTGTITYLSFEGVDCNYDSLNIIVEMFPDLTQLCLGWGNDIMFPEENPHNIQSDVNSRIAHTSQGPSLQPKSFHASYMVCLTFLRFDFCTYDSSQSIVHWAALGRIRLPPKLELLHLLGDFQFRFIMSAMLAGPEESDVQLEGYFEQQEEADGQLYSMARAKYIFAMLSERYPALKTLLTGDREQRRFSDRLSWRKVDFNQWIYENPRML